LKNATDTLTKFQKRLEKTLQLRNLERTGDPSDIIDPSFFLNDSLSTLLETKDTRIENLQREIDLLENELEEMSSNYVSVLNGDTATLNNFQEVSPVCLQSMNIFSLDGLQNLVDLQQRVPTKYFSSHHRL